MAQYTNIKHSVSPVHIAWWSIFAVLLRNIRSSFLVGSRHAWFSGSMLMTPLSGLYGGVSASFFTYVIRVAFAIIEHPQWGILSSSVYHIPSLCASLYISYCVSENNMIGRYLLGVIIPLICMAIFMTDSVGGGAWWYALYWLIPIGMTPMLGKRYTRFGLLLASTFVAHAVGSVCWLLTHHMTMMQWQALVYCVWYERLMQAFVMYAAAGVYDQVCTYAGRIYGRCRERFMAA